jgi:predicted flap endonuclease-1-like 5' DNA nuclease
MTILLVQTFLLMLGAFLLGASLACLIRRGFSNERDAAAGTSVATAAPGAVLPAGTDRFGRALSGGAGPSVPPVFQPGQPVVEVQPRPEPEPAPAPAPAPPAPVVARAPEPAPAPAPQPAPPPSPPQRDVLPPKPAPEPMPAPEPERAHGESYTQIAVAAAAAAAAVAAKAKAEAEAAERAEAEKAAAEAAAPARAPVPAAFEDAETRFGTPAATSPLERPDSEPVDDFTRIHGIDADLKERLVRYGVHRFSQIAAWTPDDVRGVSQTFGFQGRIERENWVEQAQILAAGGDPTRARAPKPPAAVDVSPVDGDRLHRIIGIDPQSEALLRANGVTQLSQIAAWTADDVVRFEALLGTGGRIEREGWVAQARFLTGGAPPAPDPEPVRPGPTEIVVEMPEPSPPPSAPRSESYSGLRSVRSEALIGDAPSYVSSGAIEDLKRIRGIGVLIEKKLNSLGITSYEQVANWTRADIDRISEVLDFKGRIERENWIEQARILASGGQTEFSRRVDRGDA